jgi:hypothetical protein
MGKGKSGIALLEIATTLFILALIAAVFLPLASGFLNGERATSMTAELRTIYSAILGDPQSNTFGYLGDVGEYPTQLLDLVSPSPVPAGWNGPYLTNVRIESDVLHDQFGAAIEYFRPGPPPVPAVPLDQLVLISKGPDRQSSNTSSNPNQSSTFTGTDPSGSTYAEEPANRDNVVYPKILDIPELANYQALGIVAFNIRDFDEYSAVNGFAAGCPALYDISISSIPRGTNEAYLTYSPGGASVDLLQGLYRVEVRLTGSDFPVWQEQIAVRPGTAIIRDLSLPGVKSDLFATVTLTIVNNSGNAVVVKEYGSPVGLTIINGATTTRTVHRCARISVETFLTAETIDTFIMPNVSFTKRYSSSPPTMVDLTVTNDGPSNTIAVYDDGLLAGTVGRRGNRRVKVFSIRSGNTITVRDENNVLLETFLLAGATTKNY